MSVFELVSELCVKIFDSEFANEWYPDLTKLRRKAVKKLRSRCYAILLHKVSIPDADYDADWSPVAQVVGHAFTLQLQGMHRDATKMGEVAHRMLDAHLNRDPVATAVLELLLRLQDSVPRKEDYEPVLFRYARPKPYDPTQGPMPYEILHPSAFEPQPWMLQIARPDVKPDGGFFPASGSFPFASEPGQNLPVLGRFLQPARLDGTGSKVALYNIPRIPALSEPRALQIPKLVYERPLADEGYATPSHEETSRNVSPCGRSPEEVMLARDAVWQAALTYTPLPLRTWEALGQRIVTKELPFLSEAGQTAAMHFIEVYQEWPRSLQAGHGSTATIPSVFLSEEQLLRDISFLLLGIQSRTFTFSEEDFAFHLAAGVRLPDLSPASVSLYCRELVELGTCARRLQLLCQRGVPAHPRTQLMEALREHVDTYLQFHWGASLLLPRGASLLEVHHWARGLHRKTVAMAQLCGVAPPSASWDGPCKLPSGMALMSYIYETVSEETRPDVCCILYSTLQAVSQVYFRFLEHWIFKGHLFDSWEEFFVQAAGSAHSLAGRDRKYWVHAFHVVREAVPGFLRGLEDDILLCGKTVHLLKLCCPKVALCVALESGNPPVPCCLRGCDLRRLSAQCQRFEKRVHQLERGTSDGSDSGVEMTQSWRKKGPSEAELRQRQESIRQARERHMLRIKLEQEAGRQAVVQRQLQWREELQQQVAEVQLRRRQQQEEQRQEELAALEANRVLQAEDNRRKEEEKQRILEYYEELSEVAEKRKQLAEWRLERLNLRDRREEFILNERREWRTAAAELNHKNLERSTTGAPLTIIEEDSDTMKIDTNPESRASIRNLPLVMTTAGDNSAAVGGVNNATTDQVSPNNNSVDNAANLGDINENVGGPVLNGKESSFPRGEMNVLNTTIEDAALGNVLVPMGNRNANAGAENTLGECNAAFAAAISNKAKIYEEEFGIPSHQQNGETKGKETDTTQSRIMAAAERNRQKVLEQEFGITSRRVERPKSVPLRSSIRDSGVRDRSNVVQESVKQNFQDTVAQRRTNRWNMLHGGTNIITGVMNPLPAMDAPQCPPSETDSMSVKDTPSDDGMQIVLQSPSSVDAPMSKSESSGSVNLVYKTASSQSSKTSSSYNITSITSSSSFDMGSGKFSLNTPMSTEDGSIDTFKTCTGSGGSFSSGSGEPHHQRDLANTTYPYWKSRRLEIDDDDLNSEQSRDEVESPANTSGKVDYTDFTSINVALQKSVAIPLYTQLRLANEAVLKYFFQDLDLFGHFLNLRSFFFLMDGEYSRTLTNSLFQKIATVRQPSHLLNYVVLNGLLQKALDASLCGCEEKAKRLSFKVSSTPEHFRLTSTEVLQCLSLRYRTDWPLNVILTKESLLKYNVIFSFLTKVRLVSWRLEQAFHHLKCTASKDFGRGSEEYHSVQLWRHEMTHLVRSFQNYIMSTALQSSWEVFERELNHAETLDNLYLMHVSYVKKILFRCLLYKKCRAVYEILMTTFNTILKFHAQLEASQWRPRSAEVPTLVHPDFRTLSKIHEAFRNCAGKLYKLVDKMIHAGYQTHLSELLEMLNANGYYTSMSG